MGGIMPRRPGPPNYRLKLRNGIWQVVWSQGTPRRLSTGTADHAEARQFLAQFLSGTGAAPKRPTIGQLLDAYLEDRGPKSVSMKRMEHCVRLLKNHFGALQTTHINRLVVKNYITARESDGVKGGTIRHELLILRAAFAWGKGSWVDVIPAIETPPASQPRERYLTREEARALIKGAKVPHMRLFILLGLYTGARSRAILDLTWDRVDMERRLIDYRLPGRITKKRRVVVPISKRIYPALKLAHAMRRTDYVIEFGGKAVRQIRGGFTLACKRAGVKDVIPHTLRHTAATWMAQAGVDMFAIAGFLGQNPMTTARIYAKHSPGYLQKALAGLEGE